MSPSVIVPFPAARGAIVPARRDDARRRARGRRCVLLLTAVVMMGVVDLLLTLTYARGVGMLELNPLARLMLEVGGAPLLIAFKFVCTGLCAGVLFLHRRTAQAEVGCWTCAAAMLLLMAHWVNYNATVSAFSNDLAVLALSEGACDLWITITN